MAVGVGGGLRREDAGVAGVGGQLLIQVHHQAQVGRELAIDVALGVGELVEVGVAVLGAVFPPGQAAAGDDGGGVGHAQVGARIQAVLLRLAVVAVGKFVVRLGDVVVGVVQVDVGVVAATVLEVLVDVAVVGAHDQFMFAAEGLERRGDEGVQAVGFPVAAVFPRDQAGVARGRVDGAVGPAEFAAGFVLFAVDAADLDAAAVGQAVLHVGEVFGDVFGDVVPARVQVGGAAHVQQFAVGVAGQAEERATLVLLVGGAGGQHGVGREVEAQGAVEQRLFGVDAVDEGAAVVVGRHQAAAQPAVAVQRAGDVGLGVVAVPGPGHDLAAEGEVLLRALAHQVHGAAGVARALEQARGAAQHFDAVVDGQAEARAQVVAGAGRRVHAVHLDRVQRVAARIEVAVVAADAARFHRDAGDGAHGVVQVHQVLVVELLARHDGDGLRDLAQALRVLAQGDGGGGVGTRAFGGGEVAAGDRDRREGRGVGGRGTCRRPDHEARGAGHGDQPALGQQAVQGGLGAHLAGDGGRLPSGDRVGAEQHLHLRLAAQRHQRVGQASGGQVEGLRGRALGMGHGRRERLDRQRGVHRQRAQQRVTAGVQPAAEMALRHGLSPVWKWILIGEDAPDAGTRTSERKIIRKGADVVYRLAITAEPSGRRVKVTGSRPGSVSRKASGWRRSSVPDRRRPRARASAKRTGASRYRAR
ncbi:hypothetical protein D9M72_328040 [compost metagenome]